MTKHTQAQLQSLETIGCDLGDKKSHLFSIRPDGMEGRLKPLATTRVAFRAFFEGRPRAHVVVEVGTHSRWTSQLLTELGHIVTVANPRKVKLISNDNQKNDDKDARDLARLGRFDIRMVSPITHRSEQVQADLAVVKTRDALIGCRTKLVNQARSLVKSFGYRLPKCDAEHFWKNTAPHVPKALKPALRPVYKTLAQLSEQIKNCDRELQRIGKKYPDVEVVGQPCGVGLLTALTFILTIEDKRRFDKSREVGPFLGLTTGKHQSGKSDPPRRITKAGDRLLRKLLVQSANYALGPFGKQSDLRTWGLKLAARGGKAPKMRARVAVARKLAVLMHSLWVTGVVYEPVGYGKKKTASPAEAA